MRLLLFLASAALLSLFVVLPAGADPPLLTGAQIQDDSLTGDDVLESSLAEVPSAQHADVADQAPVQGWELLSSNFVSVTAGSTTSDNANCSTGSKEPLGGGFEFENNVIGDASVVFDAPDGASGWRVAVANPAGGATVRFKVHVICAEAEF